MSFFGTFKNKLFAFSFYSNFYEFYKLSWLFELTIIFLFKNELLEMIIYGCNLYTYWIYSDS